jgi:signal recognition particle receptor subunit beta
MASVNPLSRELVFKVVYYGPGLGGKTTTLEHIHATAKPEHRGKLVSLATPVDRTLYFDFLPVRLPPIRGMSIRLQLFTVPGQVYFNATRKLVLTGADGVVFVSDSQAARADANLESLENLRENLAELGRDLTRIPLVFQHNKRDLPELLPVAELDSFLNPFGAPSVPTSAKNGQGIYEGLEKISAGVIAAFAERLPELDSAPRMTSFEVIEGGLAAAICDASENAKRPDDIVVAYIPAPEDYSSFPPPSSSERPPPLVPTDSAAEARPSAGPAATSENGETTALDMDDSESLTEPPASGATAIPPALSFAELWPEGEHDVVREVESSIAAGRYWRAIELCEVLVSRIFANAADLLGSLDAPREAAMVPILLGLEGRRYLAFRGVVHEARGEGLITSADALSAFAFAIEARIARSSVR